MKQNEFHKSVLLVILVVAFLLVLRFVPTFTLNDFESKKIDILSDVLRKDSVNRELAALDSLDAQTAKVSARTAQEERLTGWTDSCKAGITCLEDFSDATQRGMAHFFEALDQLQQQHRPVRIAYFGDSFIEGDILTADLRRLLQTEYGGCGVGFVPMTSQVAEFRRSVRHHFHNWQGYSTLENKKHFHPQLQGLAGTYFMPQGTATIELGGTTSYGPTTNTCERAQVFLKTQHPLQLSLTFNGTVQDSVWVDPSDHIQALTFNHPIHTLKMVTHHADSSLFYGIMMDGKEGIILDNFSLRGSSGLHLNGISEQTLRDFNQLRPYDLIILHYGLNVANDKQKDYEAYAKGMNKVIDKLKRNFPQASLLIISVSDRDHKDEYGDWVTMPAIRYLVHTQRNIAANESVAFWNLFAAMGGEGSMANYANRHPALANKDYTHINFQGGKEIARHLFESLQFGKEQYERRKQYEH